MPQSKEKLNLPENFDRNSNFFFFFFFVVRLGVNGDAKKLFVCVCVCVSPYLSQSLTRWYLSQICLYNVMLATVNKQAQQSSDYILFVFLKRDPQNLALF